MKKNISNKVAIITGASRGIGAAIARTLANDGYSVCVNYYRQEDQANKVVDGINASGGHAIAVKANVANESEVIKLFSIVDDTLGSVTTLINNAGINGGPCEVQNLTAETLQKVFATNVFGTIFSCREAVQRMKKNGGGNIVNITSEAAKFGGTNLAHYAASKAAINTFTIGFAREVAATNIRVNAVSPGVIDTEIHSQDHRAKVLNSLPMKRMGSTHEVAELVKWLVSKHASYVSGAIIPITGSR